MKNDAHLLLCHPDIQGPFMELLDAMFGHGFKLRIVWSHRTKAEQALMVANKVSNDLFSMHNCTVPIGTPASLAIDVVDKAKGYAEDPTMYATLAVEAYRAGLMTGLLFGLPSALKIARQDAINAGRINQLAALIDPEENGKRGFDPLHVQCGRDLYLKIRASLEEDPSWP